jgi:hypothetical protein
MSIKPELSILDSIEIAAPCSVPWEDMSGNERVRDCSQCKLSVYNISELSKREAENLIREREGRLCIRLYRREDGTVITDNCPVALRRIRNSVRNVARIAAAALSFVLTFSVARAGNDSGNSCQSAKGTSDKKQQSVNSDPQALQGSPAPRELKGKIRATPPADQVRVLQGEPTATQGQPVALPQRVEQGDVAVPKPAVSQPKPEPKVQHKGSTAKPAKAN